MDSRSEILDRLLERLLESRLEKLLERLLMKPVSSSEISHLSESMGSREGMGAWLRAPQSQCLQEEHLGTHPRCLQRAGGVLGLVLAALVLVLVLVTLLALAALVLVPVLLLVPVDRARSF